MIDIFVNTIFLYDDKLVITFNWKNGTKTVSLAELEASIEHSDNSIYTAKDGIMNEHDKTASGACTFVAEIVPTVSAQLEGSKSRHSVKASEAPNCNDFKSSYLDDNSPPAKKPVGAQSIPTGFFP